jgi:hypothetical protein
VAAIKERTDNLPDDPASEATAEAAKVAAEAIKTLAEAGGDGDLAAIKAKTNLVTAGQVTVTSPVTDDLDINIVQYDDYLTANNRALPWTNTSGTWFDGDISGATVTFTATDRSGTTILEKAGSVVASTGTQAVQVELTSVNTGLFTKADGKQRYKYQLLLTKTGYREMEVTGDIAVTGSLSQPST